MSTPPKPFAKAQPPTKDQLRQMLAQAVRNTQPELNLPTVPEPEPKPKRNRARASSRTPTSKPTKGPTKGKKDRARR
jgi:hypothetical protein